MGKKNKPAGKAAAAPSKPSTARNFGVLGLLGVGLALVLQAFLSSNATPPAPSRAAGEVPKHEKRAGKKAKAVVPEPTGPPAVCPEGWTNCPRVPGANWVQLEALATSPVVAPTAEALEGCHAPHSLLSPQRVPGMHLLCLLPPPPDSTAAVTIAIFKDMERTEFFADGQPRPAAVLLLPQLQTAEQAVAALVRRLHIVRKSPLYQPPALFTDSGVRLQTAAILTSPRADGGGDAGSPVRRLLCMEGGQWIWPPVEVGHVTLLPDLTAKGVTTRVVTLSLKPLVVEADHIVDRALPHMAKSGVALKDADKGKAAKEFRTSSQYFLPTTRDPVLERVDKRVMYLTRIPISHAEYIQVLRYNHMEHYSAHHDFFDPAAYASNAEMLASVEHGAKNRLATVFFYLNNVTTDADVTRGGGQTNFPRAATAQYPNGGPQVRDYFDCSKGLSVYPQAGKVIIFYSMLPNGEMDDFSLHGGCDVLREDATKFSANFWLWNKPYHFLDGARRKATAQMMNSWL